MMYHMDCNHNYLNVMPNYIMCVILQLTNVNLFKLGDKKRFILLFLCGL